MFFDPFPSFHGRGDADEPEWPPSPLRVFQSLVAAAATRWHGAQFNKCAQPALEWLQPRNAPTISAPAYHVGMSVRIAVPNNDLDVVASAWAKHQEPKKQPSELKTMKTVCPIHLRGDRDEHAIVHYLYPLAPQEELPLETLRAMAQSITHLGWGIDMAAGNAIVCSEEEAAELHGEHWLPVGAGDGSTMLRVATKGTLDDLIHRYQAFLNRIGRDAKGNKSFHPVPPLSAFRVIGYRRATDSPKRPIVAFSLLKPDASRYRAFDTARKGLTVAGMMRCAMKRAAKQARPEDAKWVDAFVLGHGEGPGEPHRPVGPKRFAYLPLPSIEFRGEGHANVVGAIRRVLVTVLADGHQREIAWAGQAMSGTELIDKQQEQPQALLSRLPNNDRQIQRYLRPSSNWATVTPMVLPGYDDCRRYRRRLKDNSDADNQKRWLGKLHERIESLIRKAIGQAGFSDVLEQHAIIEWRPTGFWPGTELASRYGVPDHLQKFSRYHVRVQWRDANDQPVSVPGPICIGGGRFFGLGLFAAIDNGD
jgi:CRISPR-associated protein Csb2